MRKSIIFIFIITAALLMTACLPSAGRIVDEIEDRLTTQEQETDEQTTQGKTEPGNTEGTTTENQGTDQDGMDWPTDKLPDEIPPLLDIQITSVMDVAGQLVIGFENGARATIDAYVDTLKGKGWESVMEIEGADGLAHTLKKDAYTIQITWSDDEQGAVMYFKQE